MKPIHPLLAGALLAPSALAADADLAKQLANPVASLISVPVQSNACPPTGLATAGLASPIRQNLAATPSWTMVVPGGASQPI